MKYQIKGVPKNIIKGTAYDLTRLALLESKPDIKDAQEEKFDFVIGATNGELAL